MQNVKLAGSCLCGSIRYVMEGEPKFFNHCHCSRCRKATGTGHASNILFAPASIEWQSGEELLKSYKVPDAKRFTAQFCSNCGSLMPRVAPDGSFGVLPAGTLDEEPGIEVTGRIFQDSRTQWSCHGDNLACFETYPGA